MKSILFACMAFLTVLAIASPAGASLGGNISSVQTDRASLRGTLKSTSKAAYSVQRIQAANGVIVREYASSTGNVFGVAWQGPTRPDLGQLLGAHYFEILEKAISASGAMRLRLVEGPIHVEQNGLVVEMGGHTRWLIGRAYVPAMIPAGVSAKDIR